MIGGSTIGRCRLMIGRRRLMICRCWLMIGRCWLVIGWCRLMICWCWLVFWLLILRCSFIGNISYIPTIRVRVIGDMLYTAIRKSNRVGSLNIAMTITMLFSIKISPSIFIMHSILIVIGRWFITIGRLGMICRSMIGWGRLGSMIGGCWCRSMIWGWRRRIVWWRRRMVRWRWRMIRWRRRMVRRRWRMIGWRSSIPCISQGDNYQSTKHQNHLK